MRRPSESIFRMKNGLSNMIKSNYYMPILKWKRAEQGAIKALPDSIKENITPLIQFVMPNYKPEEQLDDIIRRFAAHIPQLPEKLIEAWGRSQVFIDVSLLFTTSLKANSLATILSKGRGLGGNFVPVVHLNDDQAIKKAAFSSAKESGCGLCLRLVCPDFEDVTKMNGTIMEFISSGGLARKDIDLLVDIKETQGNGDKYAKYFGLSQKMPHLLSWRTFIFASGSFPEDLSKCRIDEENLIPRLDWTSWKKNAKKGIQRKPTFSDYTIQYPIYKEATQFFAPTTSIKYTLEDEWLIMKGQKQKYEQYLASAAELVKDPRYFGENFSYGDKFIKEKADHFNVYIKNPEVKGTGSTETWLRAGINHHLVLAVRQVAKLS